MPSSRQCQEGHLSAPQRPRPGLLQLALPLQDKGQVVNQDERVGVLGSQLGLAAFQGSPVQPFCLAARDFSAEVWKHEKSPSSGPMGHGLRRISQQRPPFLDYSENILFQALVKHSLNSRDAKKHPFIQFTHSVCSHCWPALTKQPWGDHGGGYGSDDRSSSQTLSNALENNQRIKPAKGLEKPCRACRQARYG